MSPNQIGLVGPCFLFSVYNKCLAYDGSDAFFISNEVGPALDFELQNILFRVPKHMEVREEQGVERGWISATNSSEHWVPGTETEATRTKIQESRYPRRAGRPAL